MFVPLAGGMDANGTENSTAGEDVAETATILVELFNTSPESMLKIIKRIDGMRLDGRVVMTLSKNKRGVLFWTFHVLGHVER